MAGIAKKSFDTPDEQRAPDKTQVEVVDLGSVKAARMTLQPGWRWSECIKPMVGTDSCQVHHVGTVGSGRLHVEHEDGSTEEMGPGDAYVIEPGHDAWVVGSEPFVGYEFDSQAAESYAQTQRAELALVLAGLFELRITNLEDTARCDAIDALAEKLGGRPVGDVLRRG